MRPPVDRTLPAVYRTLDVPRQRESLQRSVPVEVKTGDGRFTPAGFCCRHSPRHNFGRLLVDPRHFINELSPDSTVKSFSRQGRAGRSGTFGKNDMTIKMVVVPLETQYLQDEAKRLGVTRTKLVRVMMQKIIRDELVPTLLNDGDPELNEPKKPNYRRFPRGTRS
jgi:hypothetical protein